MCVQLTAWGNVWWGDCVAANDLRNWIRIRQVDGLFYIHFYNEINEQSMNIRPGLNFEISVQTIAGLLSLGYQMGATMHRYIRLSLSLCADALSSLVGVVDDDALRVLLSRLHIDSPVSAGGFVMDGGAQNDGDVV